MKFHIYIEFRIALVPVPGIVPAACTPPSILLTSLISFQGAKLSNFVLQADSILVRLQHGQRNIFPLVLSWTISAGRAKIYFLFSISLKQFSFQDLMPGLKKISKEFRKYLAKQFNFGIVYYNHLVILPKWGIGDKLKVLNGF